MINFSITSNRRTIPLYFIIIFSNKYANKCLPINQKKIERFFLKLSTAKLSVPPKTLFILVNLFFIKTRSLNSKGVKMKIKLEIYLMKI